MGALYEYQKAVQRFIRDQQGKFIDPGDLTDYINRARRELAGRTQCVRVLAPISGQITGATVTAAGTGYTAPTVTISPPDFPSHAGQFPSGDQATATATQIGGTIAAVNITYGGEGYFQPTITISDSTGTGAAATAQISPLAVTQANKEVYLFSDIPLDTFPGVGEILFVRSVSFIYSNLRYSILIYDFTTYQALIRNYPDQFQYVPVMGAQFGQGVNGSIYLYPVASNTYQMEFDCTCLPLDLTTDADFEAIPLPWTDAIPYMAASLAYQELQNLNASAYYLKLYDEMVGRYSRYARGSRAVNRYGRWIYPLILGLGSAAMAGQALVS